jgi:hypothetical protein
MEERRSYGGLVAACLLIFTLPLLYFLSIGPVLVYYSGRETPTAVHTFYTPLTWLVNHFKFANDVLDWYLGFWLA